MREDRKATVEWHVLAEVAPPEGVKCRFFFERPGKCDHADSRFGAEAGRWNGAVIVKRDGKVVQVPRPDRCWWARLAELTPPEIRRFL